MDGEEIIHLVPCSKGKGEWGTYTGTFAFLSEASHWPYQTQEILDLDLGNLDLVLP